MKARKAQAALAREFAAVRRRHRAVGKVVAELERLLPLVSEGKVTRHSLAVVCSGEQLLALLRHRLLHPGLYGDAAPPLKGGRR